MVCGFNEEDLQSLRERVRPYLTEKRYTHTLAVERCAARLGEIYLPERVMKLRAAALLHDITKRLDLEKQLQYFAKFDIIIGKFDMMSPKTFHARTAAALIPQDFPDFADPEVISGVRWHTTGHCDMTVFEAIVYLADYIEETRTFPDCVKLRRYFDGGLSAGDDPNDLLILTMVKSFDLTVACLLEEGAAIDLDTVGARNYFLGLSEQARA